VIIRIFDIESCGLATADMQAVEVATVDLISLDERLDAQGRPEWTRGRMWSSLVNPGRKIPVSAMAVHHITDEMVAGAPTFEQLLSALTDGDPIFAAHHLRFDLGAWEVSSRGAGLPDPARCLCSYKAAVTAWPDAPGHKNQELRYWLGLKLADPSLAQPHRALGDAYVTAAIVRRLLRELTVEQMIEIAAKPLLLPYFTFGKHAMRPIDELPGDYLGWVVQNVTDNEDVQHTARHHLEKRRAAQRSRSPV
jgi:exodeoxyribonuclease X